MRAVWSRANGQVFTGNVEKSPQIKRNTAPSARQYANRQYADQQYTDWARIRG